MFGSLLGLDWMRGNNGFTGERTGRACRPAPLSVTTSSATTLAEVSGCSGTETTLAAAARKGPGGSFVVNRRRCLSFDQRFCLGSAVEGSLIQLMSPAIRGCNGVGWKRVPPHHDVHIARHSAVVARLSGVGQSRSTPVKAVQ